jgi:hypothetical protein
MGILSILISAVIPHSGSLPRNEACSRQHVITLPRRSHFSEVRPNIALNLIFSSLRCTRSSLRRARKNNLVTRILTPTSDKYSKLAEEQK